MKRTMARCIILLASLALSAQVFAAPLKIGVFIPGIREGSPTYDGLAKGAERFVAENSGSTVKVFEAGFNQAEWEEKLISLTAEGKYDFILTSNPSMPDLVNKVSVLFPKQKFICLDGQFAGNPSMYTVLYNQLEQGFITGYLAGLVSSSSMPGANAAKKAGMLIGQHYPVMDKLIIPGFEKGLKAVDPAFQLDVRVLGNWYDATKALELTKSMYDAGSDVVLPIAGSASQGSVKAAQDSGKYLVFFDADEYSRAPKNIVGCTALNQERLAYTVLKDAAAGKLHFGKADIVGIKEGYVEFLDKSPVYLALLPAAIRSKMDMMIQEIKSGKLTLAIPQL